MTPDEIMEIARIIKKSKLTNKKQVFSVEYKDFAQRYPILFDMCCTDNDQDLEQLQFMIKMLKNVQDNKMTRHVASTQVGQKLFDSFVKPSVDKTD